MNRILMGLLVIGAVVAMIAGATLATFSDTETSTGNTFTAGTLDLMAGPPGAEVNNPGALVAFSNLKPSQSKIVEIGFKNVGSITGTLAVDLSLADNDDPAVATVEFPVGQVTGDNFAKTLIVTAALYDRNQDGVYAGLGEDVLSAYTSYADADLDTKLSIYEMAQKTWAMDETLAAGKSTKIKLTVHFDDTEYVGDVNDLQAEGVAVAITAKLTQLP